MGAARDKVKGLCKANGMEAEWNTLIIETSNDLMCSGIALVTLAYLLLLFIGGIFYNYIIPAEVLLVVIIPYLAMVTIRVDNRKGL